MMAIIEPIADQSVKAIRRAQRRGHSKMPIADPTL